MQAGGAISVCLYLLEQGCVSSCVFYVSVCEWSHVKDCKGCPCVVVQVCGIPEEEDVQERHWLGLRVQGAETAPGALHPVLGSLGREG